MSIGTLAGTFVWSSSTAFLAAVTPDPSSEGLDYTGVALIISAIAALITAVGGLILGLRRSSGDEIDQELRRLLKEKLAQELNDEEP